MKKKIMVKRCLALLGTLFALLNLVWFLNYVSYNKYVTDSGLDMRVAYSSQTEAGKVNYHLKRPDYLCWHGNLGSVNSDGCIGIIVWPSLFCTKPEEYGLRLYDKESEEIYQIYVDANMNFLDENYNRLSPEAAEYAEEMLETMKNQVCEQFQNMKDEFKF